MTPVERLELLLHADDGKIVDPRRAIMPLLLQHRATNGLRALGTCFPVFSRQNIFATAAHVLCDQLLQVSEKLDGAFEVADDDELVTLWFETPTAPEVKYHFRKVVRLWRHPAADLAMGQLEGMVHKGTRSRLEDLVPTWDLRPLQVGQNVATYAYPNIRGETTLETVRQAQLAGVPREGKVVEVWPERRDNLFLRGPCCAVALELNGGMSGGPVFNQAGKVCGVNSTGYEFRPGEQPLSFVSMLGPALDMRLWSSNDPDGFTVRELVGRGFLKVINVPPARP